MTHRATFTLNDENYAFLSKVPLSKRSAYINSLLDQSRKQLLEAEILKANLEEAKDREYRDAIEEWDVTLSDGLTDE